MNKRERQQTILSLIQARPIGTQEDLRALLERAGVPATQSSVSRDLEELGVVKHHGHYTLPRTNGSAARGLLSLDHAGDCLVIARTVPGLASAVAVEIDAVASGACSGVQAAMKAAAMINAIEVRRIVVSLIQEILQQIGRAR